MLLPDWRLVASASRVLRGTLPISCPVSVLIVSLRIGLVSRHQRKYFDVSLQDYYRVDIVKSGRPGRG